MEDNEKLYKRLKDRMKECGECLEWTGSQGPMGHHPQIKIDGKVHNVRRLFYTLNKKLYDGKMLRTTCGNPKCLNPDHIKQMDHSELGFDVAKTGVYANPVRCEKISQRMRGAKLTQEIATEIRFSTESGPKLAEKYGVCKSLVNKIKNGELWKDYRNPFAGLMNY